MQFPKRVLILLGSVGLLFLGACSNGQEATTSSSSSPAPETSSSQSGTQSLKPETQTGAAHMTLNAPANPLPQGKNVLTLTMDSKDKPVAAQDVQVAMTMTAKEMDAMGMKGMGAGSAKTQVKPAAASDTYDIETSVPFAGNWQIKVDLKGAKPPASAVFNIAVK